MLFFFVIVLFIHKQTHYIYIYIFRPGSVMDPPSPNGARGGAGDTSI